MVTCHKHPQWYLWWIPSLKTGWRGAEILENGPKPLIFGVESKVTTAPPERFNFSFKSAVRIFVWACCRADPCQVALSQTKTMMEKPKNAVRHGQKFWHVALKPSPSWNFGSDFVGAKNRVMEWKKLEMAKGAMIRVLRVFLICKAYRTTFWVYFEIQLGLHPKWNPNPNLGFDFEVS